MIVINDIEAFDKAKTKKIEALQAQSKDIQLVKLATGYYCVGEQCLLDPDFKEILEETGYIIREVKEDEFIKYDLINGTK